MRSSARTAPGRPGTITGSGGAMPSTISSASPAARSRSGSSPNCATERQYHTRLSSSRRKTGSIFAMDTGLRRCDEVVGSAGHFWGGAMIGRNPQTIEEARAFVARVESLFMPWDIPGLLAGFTDDCIVRFGDLPEFRGKAALERMFRRRSERQKGYRLRKQFRALMGDTIANYWEGEWEDRVTGAKMTGRGVEIWAMRGGKIAVWEAAFNTSEVGKPSAMGLS